jgi:hypothetical protein
MTPEIFFEKWKHDIIMLSDAYSKIEYRKIAEFWYPLCFLMLYFIGYLFLRGLFDQIGIERYVAVWILTPYFCLIGHAMKKEYDGLVREQELGYNIITFCHSLSPELENEYKVLSQNYTNLYEYYDIHYIGSTIDMLEQYENNK